MNPTLLQLLGTGTAFHADGRGSQALLFRPDRRAPFLVDLGPTAVSAMTRFGVDHSEIDALFVTHLHGDHTAGWPFLLLNLIFIDRRTRPFDVFGPVGTRACLDGLARLCYPDAFEKATFEVRYHELPIEEADGLDGGGGTFDALPMKHHPSSLGYRFRLGSSRVAVSGDTGWCTNLERLARGSDLVVVECTTRDERLDAHICLGEIREGIIRLGGARVLLVHLTDDVAVDLAADPMPGVTAGHDGMVVPL